MLKKSAVMMLAVTMLTITAAPAKAGIFTDRGDLETKLGSFFTDTYDGYTTKDMEKFTDAEMTTVKQQASYTALEFKNNNTVFEMFGNYLYCAGCNGSFKLGFDQTSYGSSFGVYGVGFDVYFFTGFSAFVTFGDGATVEYALENGFFGITSTSSIASIALASASGSSSDFGQVAIDNLTIGTQAGAVPEPATWAMMALGFGGIGFAVRRRKGMGSQDVSRA